MKTRGAFLFVTISVVTFACARTSARNESCQSTADCAGDLVCISGVCSPVNLGISQGPNECVAVQCTTADDCCASPPCTNYACTNDKCVASQSCASNIDCFGLAHVCNNGTCVQCVQNSDCGANETCNNNTCSAGCTADNECPIFYACQSGACNEVGCESDRECVLYRNSEFAFCDQSQSPPTCSEKCENDAECGKDELCVNGGCVNAGCNDDEECKAILGPLPQGEHAVCRPKQ